MFSDKSFHTKRISNLTYYKLQISFSFDNKFFRKRETHTYNKVMSFLNTLNELVLYSNNCLF